jgi:hypothetical protein
VKEHFRGPSERIDVSVSSPVAPVMTVQVFQWTGTAIGALLGTGTALPPDANGVSGLILASPVPVAAGSIYVLRLTIAFGFTYIKGDSAQTTPIPYLVNCAGNPGTFPPCTALPASGTHGTWLKLRAGPCGQTLNAFATSIGAGCGNAPTFTPPALWTPDPPLLGTSFPMIVSGYFGPAGTVQLFWAAGPATAGLNLGLGFGCTSYLDPATLQLRSRSRARRSPTARRSAFRSIRHSRGSS